VAAQPAPAPPSVGDASSASRASAVPALFLFVNMAGDRLKALGAEIHHALTPRWGEGPHNLSIDRGRP
jgi:hypothetical protein